MSDMNSILGTQSSAWTNPMAQQGALSNAAGGVMGKDQFLKLLVAQMQNQDPLNPMDGMQFASQLAQFSTVEQLQQLNTEFDRQAASQMSILASVNGSVAVSTFGREVMALGDQLNVGGDSKPEAIFDAPAGGGRVKVHIYNDAGREVGTADLGFVGEGQKTMDLSKATADLPAGTYHYEVDLTDDAGAVTHPQTYMKGRVDGVHYTDAGPVLTAGGMDIPFGAILKIVTAD